MRQFKVTERYTVRSSGIERYLNEISKINMLTPDEEAEVAKRAAKGDEAAIEKLVRSNLRFVVSVAKQYGGSNVNLFEDLINEGNNGLLDAARTFNPETGFKFISYAVWHIRKYMLKYLTDHSRQIRLPLNRVSTISKMKIVESDLSHKLGRVPTQDEVIDEYLEQNQDKYSLDSKRIEKVKDNLSHAVKADVKPKPWESPLTDHEDSQSPADIYDGSPDLENNIIGNLDGNNLIMSYIKRLGVLNRDVIIKYHGLNGDEPMAFSVIAEGLECSTETIRQRYKVGLRQLRSRLRRDGITIDNFF